MKMIRSNLLRSISVNEELCQTAGMTETYCIFEKLLEQMSSRYFYSCEARLGKTVEAGDGDASSHPYDECSSQFDYDGNDDEEEEEDDDKSHCQTSLPDDVDHIANSASDVSNDKINQRNHLGCIKRRQESYFGQGIFNLPKELNV